jgi:hypothetical protein
MNAPLRLFAWWRGAVTLLVRAHIYCVGARAKAKSQHVVARSRLLLVIASFVIVPMSDVSSTITFFSFR